MKTYRITDEMIHPELRENDAQAIENVRNTSYKSSRVFRFAYYYFITDIY